MSPIDGVETSVSQINPGSITISWNSSVVRGLTIDSQSTSPLSTLSTTRLRCRMITCTLSSPTFLTSTPTGSQKLWTSIVSIFTSSGPSLILAISSLLPSPSTATKASAEEHTNAKTAATASDCPLGIAVFQPFSERALIEGCNL